MRTTLDSAGIVLSSVNYSPYGVPDTSITGFAFTGEQRDSDGLQYHRARYYNPSLGMWASLDPFEGFEDEPMSLNGYGYVHGNPINATDPTGEFIGALALGGFALLALAGLLTYLAQNQRSFPPVQLPGLGLDLSDAIGLICLPALAGALGGAVVGSPGWISAPPISMPNDQSREIPNDKSRAKDDAIPLVRLLPRVEPPKVKVNLDTGTLTGLVSYNPRNVAESISIKLEIIALVASRQMSTTTTAFAEFTSGVMRLAGPIEQVQAAILLTQVEVVTDNISLRFIPLPISASFGIGDKMIFGTGDQMNIQTLTGNPKALAYIRSMGIADYNGVAHRPARFREKFNS